MSVGTLVAKVKNAVRTNHLLKYLKAAERATGVDRSSFTKFAKLKLTRYTDSLKQVKYNADLTGDFCTAYQEGKTPKDTIEKAVRYADSEHIKITAVVRKY